VRCQFSLANDFEFDFTAGLVGLDELGELFRRKQLLILIGNQDIVYLDSRLGGRRIRNDLGHKHALAID
jgi:hypothetical protein